MAAYILSRQGQSQTNAVKAQDYGKSVLDRRGDWLEDFVPQGTTQVPTAQLYGSSEDYCKTLQTSHAAKRCFAQP
ncbi:hypothetical protein TNCT_626861 [Trichonephila clavata]|uniref:Uncharacterized protein n=1 Tax=Trichonephila clavata TaxID=2740835 RepID=A0A8X6K7G7_TRICU|nr:hypothetical protein TNCT_626861 [Trichonephila clavata]